MKGEGFRLEGIDETCHVKQDPLPCNFLLHLLCGQGLALIDYSLRAKMVHPDSTYEKHIQTIPEGGQAISFIFQNQR